MGYIAIRRPTDVLKALVYQKLARECIDEAELVEAVSRARLWGTPLEVHAEPLGICIEVTVGPSGLAREAKGAAARELLDYLVHYFSNDHIGGLRFAKAGHFLAVSSSRSENLRVVGPLPTRTDQEDGYNFDLFRIGPMSPTEHAVVFDRCCAWYYAPGNPASITLVGEFPEIVQQVLRQEAAAA